MAAFALTVSDGQPKSNTRNPVALAGRTRHEVVFLGRFPQKHAKQRDQLWKPVVGNCFMCGAAAAFSGLCGFGLGAFFTFDHQEVIIAVSKNRERCHFLRQKTIRIGRNRPVMNEVLISFAAALTNTTNMLGLSSAWPINDIGRIA